MKALSCGWNWAPWAYYWQQQVKPHPCGQTRGSERNHRDNSQLSWKGFWVRRWKISSSVLEHREGEDYFILGSDSLGKRLWGVWPAKGLSGTVETDWILPYATRSGAWEPHSKGGKHRCYAMIRSASRLQHAQTHTKKSLCQGCCGDLPQVISDSTFFLLSCP